MMCYITLANKTAHAIIITVYSMCEFIPHTIYIRYMHGIVLISDAYIDKIRLILPNRLIFRSHHDVGDFRYWNWISSQW